MSSAVSVGSHMRRGRSRRACSLLLAFVFAAVFCAVCLAGHASAARADDSDAVVRFIGVRGSGDPYPLGGSLLSTVAQKLRKRLPSSTDWHVVGLDYRAVAVDWRLLYFPRYFDSVDTGVQRLHDLIHAEFANGANANEQIVLAGYSQGAHVVGDLLSNGNTGNNHLSDSELSHIKAVVLFGDPRFNSQESFDRGSFVNGRNGLLGARSPGDLSRAQSGDRIRSWAHKDDMVCQGGFQTEAHDQDGYAADYGDAAAAFAFSKLGFSKPPVSVYGGKLDVAFVIDTTGSMGSSIDAVKGAAINFASQLQGSGSDFQLGLVEFKDGDQGDPFAAQLDLGFTADISSFQSAVNVLTPDGGGDTPEYDLSGISTAIDGLSWRSGAKKTIIVMTDAPYKDPEPVGGLTTAAVLQAARDLDPAQIYPVVVGGYADPSQFQILADDSGGTLYLSDGPAQAADAIAQAIEQSIIAPVAALSSSSPARPGDAVEFNAGGSYDPSGDEITRYEWDFDGDGTVDTTTSIPLTSHVYTAAFTGSAMVTVHSPAGEASASTAIVISAATPRAPGAVGAIGGHSSSPGLLALHWRAPTEDGGSPLVGYRVLISTVPSNDLAIVGVVDASVLNGTFSGLDSGVYYVSVSAFNDVGEGPETTVRLTVSGSPSPTDTTPPVTSVQHADDSWHNTDVHLTLSAEDNLNGSGMNGGSAATEYQIDGGFWTHGTSITVAAPADHSNDGIHAVSYRSTDAAGNVETAKSAMAKIDTATPTTTITGLPTTTWVNKPVTLSFDAADQSGLSGIARTEYQLDSGAWTLGTSLTISGEGIHTVLYRSVDVAGNIETVQSATVRIDTVEPTSSATNNVSARRGKLARLRYSVSDCTPSCGMVTVRLTIKRGAKTVKTVSLSGVPTNRARIYSFRATLARGSYVWSAQASDIAGNVGKASAVKKLVVR